MGVEISKRGQRGPCFIFVGRGSVEQDREPSEGAREDLEWKRRHLGPLGLVEES